jgi:ATP-binding cassette subfamily B (MDR/TAP) protein 6
MVPSLVVTPHITAAMNLLNLVQNLIIVSTLCGHALVFLTVLCQTVGLLVGSMIVAHRIVKDQLDRKYFVFFIVYLAQVGPIT